MGKQLTVLRKTRGNALRHKMALEKAAIEDKIIDSIDIRERFGPDLKAIHDLVMGDKDFISSRKNQNLAKNMVAALDFKSLYIELEEAMSANDPSAFYNLLMMFRNIYGGQIMITEATEGGDGEKKGGKADDLLLNLADGKLNEEISKLQQIAREIVQAHAEVEASDT